MPFMGLGRTNLIIYINAMSYERVSGNTDFICLSHFKIPILSLDSVFQYEILLEITVKYKTTGV